MTNALVLQRFTRVSLLGVDVEARTDIADEPVFEAEDLGRLLEYKESRACRKLVRRLLDDGRLSCTAGRRVPPQNSAENASFTVSDDAGRKALSVPADRPVDVYAVEVVESHGVRLGTTEQLWLTERACLLVATASDTERAWQVRTALVDFFLEARRQRVVHSETAANAAAQRALDEARALHMSVVEQLELDARVRKLEQRRERKPRTVMHAGAVDSASLEASLTTLHRPGVNGDELVAGMEKALEATGRADITAREALAANPMLARFGDTPHRLGLTLRGLHGKAFGGRRLVAIPSRKDVARWYVETSE